MTKVKYFLALLAIVGLSVSTANAQFDGGDGSSETPYQINTAAQLEQLATLVNAGNPDYNSKNYILTAPIDLSAYQSGEGWIPIGDYSNAFKGVFDGNHKKITELKIDNYTHEYVGLFGKIEGGTIKNVGVENATIVIQKTSGYSYAGGMAGNVTNTNFSNCYFTGTINSSTTTSSQDAMAGGIVGSAMSNCSISNCYSTGTISSSSSNTTSYAGGLAGAVAISSNVSNCYSTAAISSSSKLQPYAGGLAGSLFGCDISNCAALNSGINCSAGYTGRVAGRVQYSSNLSNNIAFSRMLNAAGNTTWENKGLTAIDGADFTAQQINNDGTLGNRFTPPNWTVLNGYLPGLDIEVKMPWHLLYHAPAPVITQQPQDATVTINETHTLTVAANEYDHCTLGYRWYSNTTNSNVGGTAITGATDATYNPSTVTAGTFYYYAEVTNYMQNNGNGGNLSASVKSNAVTFTVIPSEPPVITTENLPNGMLGTPYSQTLTANGTQPITWEITAGNLPDGFSFAFSGAISGTPTKEGTYSFTVKASNVAGYANKTLSIEIGTVGINEIFSANINAYIQNGILYINGLTAGEIWNVYNVLGACIHRGIATGKVETILLRTCGLYIVQSRYKNVKVVW